MVESIEEGWRQKAKAKVVAPVWGATLIKFLAVLAFLPRSVEKRRRKG